MSCRECGEEIIDCILTWNERFVTELEHLFCTYRQNTIDAAAIWSILMREDGIMKIMIDDMTTHDRVFRLFAGTCDFLHFQDQSLKTARLPYIGSHLTTIYQVCWDKLPFADTLCFHTLLQFAEQTSRLAELLAIGSKLLRDLGVFFSRASAAPARFRVLRMLLRYDRDRSFINSGVLAHSLMYFTKIRCYSTADLNGIVEHLQKDVAASVSLASLDSFVYLYTNQLINDNQRWEALPPERFLEQYPRLAIRMAELLTTRPMLSALIFKRRAAEVAIALQSLRLPVLQTLAIVDALLPNMATMHYKWQLLAAVRHFHDRKH